jgi:hypothetical protein
MMQEQFVFTVKNNQVKTIYFLSALIITALLFSFLYVAIYVPKNKWAFLYAALLLVALIVSFIKKHKTVTFHRLAYFVAVLGILKLENYYLVFAVAIIPLFLKDAVSDVVLKFNNKEIIIENLLSKKLQWQQIEHIVLKDGLLTIMLKNKKYYQYYIQEDMNDISTFQFNAFCSRFIQS